MSDRQGREMLAECEPRLRLVEVHDVAGNGRFEIEELDERGVVTESTHYPKDELFSAIADYNDRTLATLDADDAAVVRVGFAAIYAMGDRDLETLAAILDDDFVFIDHRPIGYPVLDKAGMIGATEANADSRSRWMSSQLHVATATGWVVSGGNWTSNFDQWTQFEVGVWVGIIQRGQIVRGELFPEDRLSEALARFSDLARLDQGISPPGVESLDR